MPFLIYLIGGHTHVSLWKTLMNNTRHVSGIFSYTSLSVVDIYVVGLTSFLSDVSPF